MNPFRFARFLLILFALLLSVILVQAQPTSRLPEDLRAYKGNAYEYSILLSVSDSASVVTAKLYYDNENLKLVPPAQQPVVSRSGRIISFRWAQTTALPAKGFLEILFDGIVRYNSTLIVSKIPTYQTAPGQLTIVSPVSSAVGSQEVALGDMLPPSLSNRLRLGANQSRFGQTNSSGQFQPFALQTELVTGGITETTNMWFTPSRARASFSVSPGLTYNSSTGQFGMAPIVGDISIPAGSQVGTLATVTSTTGTFGAGNVVPRLTVDGKGRVTGVSTSTITPGVIGGAANFSLQQFKAANLGNAPPKTINFTGTDGGLFTLDSSGVSMVEDTAIVRKNGNNTYVRFEQGRYSVAAWGYTYLPLSSTAVQPVAVQVTNTKALNRAFASGKSLWVPVGVGDIKGQVRADNVNVDVEGLSFGSFIRQNLGDTTLNINESQGKNTAVIRNLSIMAQGAFTKGQAIYVRSYDPPVFTETNARSSVTIQNVNILPSNIWTPGITPHNGFHTGIEVFNPSQVIMENNLMVGAADYGYSADGTTAIRLSANHGATLVMIRNNQIGNWGTGIKTDVVTNTGIEGLNVDYNAIIAYDGIDLNGTGGPGWTMTNNHIAARRTNINLNQVGQVVVDNNLLYQFGNNNSGDFAQYIAAYRVGLGHITHNKLLWQGTGSELNDPNGIIVSGSPQVLSSGVFLDFNYIALKPSGNKYGIWLRDFTQLNTVAFNTVVNGAKTVVQNLPFNTIKENFPKDVEDGHEARTLDAIAGSPGQYRLDLTWHRAGHIILPASEAGKTISDIVAPIGDKFTIETAVPMAFTHNSSIRLAGMSSFTTTANQKINFNKTSYSSEETSRSTTPYVLPVATPTTLGGDFAPGIQTFTANSSSVTSTTVNLSLGNVIVPINIGTGTQKLVLNSATARIGYTYIVTRFDNNIVGPIEVSATTSLVQNEYQQDGASISLFNDPGQRTVFLNFDGTRFRNISTGAFRSTPNDIEITDFNKGLILRSPNNARWRVTVSNAGTLSTNSVP